ncbi:MAG: TlpA disulfide reductase family protein [Methylobacter sp.]|nr:TlpA disulfide reductase family protein [Methylobacter sp.]
MNAKHRLPGLLLLALISIVLSVGCSKTITSAPDVTLTTITGKKIALKDLRGKPVIVTFWATDCPSCIEEIPDLIDLYTRYHASGLEMIAVAMYYDPPNHVVDMTKTKQLPYNVALDVNSEHAEAFGGVMFTPSTFLIGPDGSVVKKETGLFDSAKMKTNIESLLKG